MSNVLLPNRLWRPLAEVKNFLEKMSSGVKLPQMSQKVKTFAGLNRKDKDILIQYLSERESVYVIQARPTTGGNLTTFFYHKKHGLPKAIDGYDWDGSLLQNTPSSTSSHEIESDHVHSPSENEVLIQRENELPVVETEKSEATVTDPITEETKPELTQDVIEKLQDKLSTSVSVSVSKTEAKPFVEKVTPVKKASAAVVEHNATEQPDDLRKRALEMLMKAEKADQTRLSDIINTDLKPKIDSFIERLNKANDAVQSTLDTLYDQMGEVDKIAMEFKRFASEICDA